LSRLVDPVEEEHHHLVADHPPIDPGGRPEEDLGNQSKHLAEEDHPMTTRKKMNLTLVVYPVILMDMMRKMQMNTMLRRMICTMIMRKLNVVPAADPLTAEGTM